jgi:hypothetical protein
MIAEGYAILGLKKQITPLPTRVLHGLGGLMLGSEKSQRLFAGKMTQKGLRDYAGAVLVFGVLILLSSLVYLHSVILS